MRCEDQLFSEQLVVEQEQRAIEELKFIIPQDMKYLWLCCGGVTNELPIISKDPSNFSREIRARILVSTQIEEIDQAIIAQLRQVEVIATDKID